MDTRQKILGSADSLPHAPLLLVRGLFDVLQPGHLERLASLPSAGRLVVAQVLDRPGTLLTLAARAELAAALTVIDYVVTEDVGSHLSGTETVDLEAADAASTDRLIDHVRRRHAR